MRFMAVDWSGAKRHPDRRIWLAEVTGDRLVALENGRDREGLTDHLISEARRDPDMIVGLDFAFSFPAWFVRQQGCRTARALWAVCDERGEDWVRVCAPPFWGRPGRACPADATALGFRETEREVPVVAGIRPKSVFQIGGAGAVGTGSIRGMAMLARFHRAGFSVWPFDPPAFPMVVEIYPRLLTGPITKSSEDSRRAYLRNSRAIRGRHREQAAMSEDAFDAGVSAVAVAAASKQLTALRQSTSRVERLEGRIWYPTS